MAAICGKGPQVLLTITIAITEWRRLILPQRKPSFRHFGTSLCSSCGLGVNMIAIQKRDGVPTVLKMVDRGFSPLSSEEWDEVLAEGFGHYEGSPVVAVEPAEMHEDGKFTAAKAIELIRELSPRNVDADYRAAVLEIVASVR